MNNKYYYIVKFLPNIAIAMLLFVIITYTTEAKYDFFDYTKDSITKIEKQLKIENNSKKRADLFIDMCNYYIFYDNDVFYSYMDSLLQNSIRVDYKVGYITYLNFQCENERKVGNIQNATRYIDEAIALSQSIKNDTLLALSYFTRGKLFTEFVHYNQALNSLLKASKIYERLHLIKEFALVQLSLGRLHFWFDDFESMMKDYQNAKLIFQQTNEKLRYAQALVSIGEGFLKRNMYDSSYYYLNLAQIFAIKYKIRYIEIQSKRFMGSYLFSRGLVDSAITYSKSIVLEIKEPEYFLFKGDIFTFIAHCYQNNHIVDSAIFYNIKALETRKSGGFKIILASSYINIGSSYLSKKDYTNSIKYLDSGLTIAIEVGKYIYTTSALLKLSRAYEGYGNVDSAYTYLKKYFQFKDSLENEQRTKEFAILSGKYEIEKKNYVINKATIDKQRTFLIFVTIFASLLLIIAAITMFSLRVRKKDNELLLQQKEEINNALEMIQDSQLEMVQLNEELEKRVEERTLDMKAEITKRILAEEKLIQSKENITKAFEKEKELNKLKSDLINMISHEYRTPLTVISASTDLLRYFDKNNDPDKFDRQLQKISFSVERMTSFLDNVLTFERIKSIQSNQNIKEIELVKFVQYMANEQVAVTKNTFDIKISSNKESILFETDETMLWHICNNLISNAIKFSQKRLEIIIAITDFNNFTTISFKDFGIGIAETEIKHIFDPFFRGNNTGFIQGTGFGLSIVQSFVDMINGDIQVHSKLNEGSEFILTLHK